jgi:hypothetical protein
MPVWAPRMVFTTASMGTHLNEQCNSILPAPFTCREALPDGLFPGNIYSHLCFAWSPGHRRLY